MEARAGKSISQKKVVRRDIFKVGEHLNIPGLRGIWITPLMVSENVFSIAKSGVKSITVPLQGTDSSEEDCLIN